MIKALFLTTQMNMRANITTPCVIGRNSLLAADTTIRFKSDTALDGLIRVDLLIVHNMMPGLT